MSMNILQRTGGQVASPIRNAAHSSQNQVGRPSTDHLDPLSFLDSLDEKQSDEFASPYSIEGYSIGASASRGGGKHAHKYEYKEALETEVSSSGTVMFGTKARGKPRVVNDANTELSSDIQSSSSAGRKPPPPTIVPVDPFASVSSRYATADSTSGNNYNSASRSENTGTDLANQKQAEELRRALAALEESKQEADRLRQEKLIAIASRNNAQTVVEQAPAMPAHIAQQQQDRIFDLALQQKQQSALMEQQSAAMTAQLEKQKLELQQLMESIQREKQEMITRAELVAAEKSRQQQEDAMRAERERDELRSALEVMQMQNQLLASRMEKSQVESRQQLEMERAERILAVSRMESENRALLEAQERAQQELGKEREELRIAMKKMEHEKNELLHRVQATEERAKNEGILVELQKAEFQESIRRLETEKISLARRVEENENQSKIATAAVALQLGQERDELRERMARMEADKAALAQTLLQTDQQAKQHAEQLAAQLATERAELKQSLERMEAEKKDLVTHLTTAEKAAQDQAASIAAQLAREKEELRSAMDKMEAEKKALAARLDENELQVAKVREEASETAAKTLAETDQQAKQHAETLAAKLASERAELQARLDAMAQEKTELAAQLAITEQTAKKREELMDERLGREREELKLAVLKMKEEMLAERQAELQAAAEAAATAAAASLATGNKFAAVMQSAAPNSGASGQGGGLKPTKSLYDMLESTNNKTSLDEAMDCAAAAVTPPTSAPQKTLGSKRLSKQLSRHNMVPHHIGMIPEGKEDDENFMDTWSDDGSFAGSRAGSRRPSLQSAIFTQAQERNLQLAESQWNAGMNSSSSVGSSDARAPDLVDPNIAIHALTKLQQQLQEKKNSFKIADPPTEAAAAHLATPNETEAAMMDAINVALAPEQPPANSQPEVDPFEDLPAPHAAAAGGDVERLKLLGSLESSLLSSFDSAHRSPLFYASAYGQETVAKYLLTQSPEMMHQLDIHGDSPLHAAASSGSVSCLDMLLTSLSSEIDSPSASGPSQSGVHQLANPRNQMNMTPAHLAKSIDVLEVLFRHGADLHSLDNNGRSPLFIACAMNREDCAEYIINCLDKEGRNLYEKDTRGDTPLHAAACNGSVDCLLLLLQFGVDPRVLNKKGLKAIDLAIRNKQKKCRDMLAEYHLHFCTGSDFDSVLFLATLEGHRQVKQAGEVGMGSDEGYHIIKSGSGNTSAASSIKTLKHAQSMFSLKANKSLRLQKWGQWLAYEDANSNRQYWYNHSTNEGQWEVPEEVVRLQQNDTRGNVSGSHEHGLTHKMSMRLKKHGDWIEYATGNGKPFFYNEKNGEFQWENPIMAAAEGRSSKNSNDKKHSKSAKERDLANVSKSTGSGADAASVPAAEQFHSKAGAWRPYKDPESGTLFWYNHETCISQWEEPAEVRDERGSAGQQFLSDSALATDDHDEVVHVMTDDDLGL